MRFTHAFYCRSVVEVAKDLLGQTLVFGSYKGIITETEAYRGADDEASHAFKGLTPRSHVMFGPPGHAYVYMIYGMYFCLNIVAEETNQAGAVLLRGLLLKDINLNGPGKLCRHLGITKEHNGLNLMEHESFYVTEGLSNLPYLATPRIGIRKATDKLWRFVLKDIKELHTSADFSLHF